MSNEPTHNPTVTAADRVAPLCCPGCGYNLTGVCTLARPEGTCPECGRAFERGALHRYTLAQQRARPNLVVWLLVWPIGYAIFLPAVGCCCAGVFGDSPGVGIVMALGVVGLACAYSGYWLAYNACDTQRVGRERDEVPWFYRSLAWPWLLFTLAHAVLTLVFFAGGCALILGLLRF